MMRQNKILNSFSFKSVTFGKDTHYGFWVGRNKHYLKNPTRIKIVITFEIL